MRADQERASAELAQYIADIQIAIESEWARPPSARPGLNCVVKVFQLPTGDVMDVQVASCNGDAAVVRSIEAAVKSASPLPRPKNTALFRRNLDVVFQPDP
jgi:colicin import membrane protein